MARQSLLSRFSSSFSFGRKKGFVPALNPHGRGVVFPGAGGQLKDYQSKHEQVEALVGWVDAANSAIAEPCAAVELKVYQKQRNGKQVEIFDHELSALIDAPNALHTGEQLRELHFTYMNVVGESYIYMRDRNGNPFTPAKGKLPASWEIFPAHLVQFQLGQTFSASTVSVGALTLPVTAFIRDIKPDPRNPYHGRSIIASAAAAIDLEEQMKTWNRTMFANAARPSMIITTKQPLDDKAFTRLQQQVEDAYTGTDNAHKPFLLEGDSTVTPWMLNQQDLDFLQSRKFSRDEIFAMFKLQPGMVGITENVNRANMEAGIYVNAVINVVPRLRHYVKKLNATLVRPYDPSFFVDFVNPVPEDAHAKLEAAAKGVDKWWTKDEVRAMYGDTPLPNKRGEHIIVTGAAAATLESVVDGPATPAARPDSAPQDTDSSVSDNDDPDDTPPDVPTDKGAGAPGGGGAAHAKQINARDFPGLYEGIDIDVDNLGCIMVDTEPIEILRHVDGGEADLAHASDRHDHAMGAVAETAAHVTLLYGLLENGNTWKDKVDELLSDWTLDAVTIEQVGAFAVKEGFAIVGHLAKTAELIDGHERLTLLPHIQTFSEYRPHLTLAYISGDQDTANKWVDALGAVYNGATIATRGINYGDPADGQEKLAAAATAKALTAPQAAAREEAGEAKSERYRERGEVFEGHMLTALRGVFEQQRLALIEGAKTKNLAGYATKRYTKKDKKDYLNALAEWAQYDEQLAAALAPILFALIAETGKDALGQVGADPDDFNPVSQDVLDYYQARAGKIAVDVNGETEKQIRATLSQGIDAGDDDHALLARIEAVMGAALTYRAERIARTEVARAQGFADTAAWTQSALVSGKEFYCVNDERSCPFCRSVDGTIVELASNFYSLGDVLVTDAGTLNVSYDDVATPPLHPSCRCQVLPVTVPLAAP